MLKQDMPSFDFRIQSGILYVQIRKKLPWYFLWLPSKFYSFKAHVKITTASGVEFSYPSFSLFLTKEQAKDTLIMFREVCNSALNSVKYTNHKNPNVRDLVYLKQTDFREIPIRIQIDSDQDKGKNGGQMQSELKRGEIAKPNFLLSSKENNTTPIHNPSGWGSAL